MKNFSIVQNFICTKKSRLDVIKRNTKKLGNVFPNTGFYINYNSDNADHHGVNFCATYLKIVKEFVGEIEYKALQTSFNSYHVKAYDECCF